MGKEFHKILLYFGAFFIPFFFLPITQNILDFPKHFLFLVLTLLSLIFWLGSKIYERKIILRKSKIFYIFLILFFLSFFVSSFFSVDWRVSFFGLPTENTDNFLTVTIFLIFAFLLFNSFLEKAEFLPFLFCLVLAVAIISFLNLLHIYGFYVYPFEFTKTPAFNPIGTPNALALFSALILPLSLILFLKSKEKFKIIFVITSLVLVLNILLINFKTAWFLLIIEIPLLFIFIFSEKIKFSFSIILVLILVLSIFFYFFPFSFPGFPKLPFEVSLSFPAELYIIKNTFFNNIKNILIGTGPGTFSFDFSLYRSPLINQTIFWSNRFVKGHSTFFDWLLTKGFLGAIVLFLFYSVLVYLVFKNLTKRKDEFFEIKLGISIGLIGIILASFFYPFNFVFYFLFWVFVSAFFLFQNKDILEIDISSVNKNFLVNTIFILIFSLSLVMIFFQTKKYIAEIYYWKGINSLRTLNNYDLAINFLRKATSLNPSYDTYWRDLAQFYLSKANIIAQDKNLNAEEKKRLANLAIIQGSEAINQAVRISPKNVANWNVRGFFYQNLVGIEGAAENSLFSYQQAIQLEPNSPYSYTEKGRVYILQAQNFAQKGDEKSKNDYLNFAISILQKALELKPDYAPAHYLLAVAYDQLGKAEEAISKLEETKFIAPNDWGLLFQLGILYWRKQNFQKAQEQFENALQLNPDYSNARYMLGLIFEKKGEKEKAIEQFEKILAIEPDNEQIKKILENAKKGLPFFEGITTGTSAIQDLPPEIKK